MILNTSEKALRQLTGCPEECPLVKGKPCDPDAVYTKLDHVLAKRPEAGGFKFLCEPCQKLVQRAADTDAKLVRQLEANEREHVKGVKQAVKDQALEAEAWLRETYKTATTAYEDALAAVARWEGEQRRLDKALSNQDGKVARLQNEMLVLRQRMAQAYATRKELERRAAGGTEKPDPMALEQQTQTDLQAALTLATKAWALAPNRLRRKKRDVGLHKKAKRHLERQST